MENREGKSDRVRLAREARGLWKGTTLVVP
jgi:hypothetical protein